MRTCAGSGKHDLTHVVEREDSQRSQCCFSSERKCPRVPEATEWPHQATYRVEGNLFKTPTSSPVLTLEARHSRNSQSRAVCTSAGFHASTTLQQIISLISSSSLVEGVQWNQLLVIMKTSTQHDSQRSRKVEHTCTLFWLFTVYVYSK